MATSLLKLTMTASVPTTTAVPTALRYFNTVPAGGYTGADHYDIPLADWVDDTGSTPGALVPAAANNGYYNLFINGQLQEGNVVTSVTATSATITFGATTAIDAGKIIALAVTNFAPQTTAPDITG